MIKLAIFSLIFFLSQNLYSQSPPVKKEIKIRIYHYWGGETNIDTFVTEFTPEGNLKKYPLYLLPPKQIEITHLDSTKTIFSNKNYIHKRQYWSDSTRINIYTTKSDKSISKIYIREEDTIKIREVCFKNKINPKFKFEKFDCLIDRFNPYHLNYRFENANKATVQIREQNGFKDSLKISNFPILKNHEKSIYNSETKEWYVKEKVIFKKRKKIIWETFYHESHKKYFTTNRILYFNKYNHLVKEFEYDDYSILTQESYYYYEYY